MTQQLVAAFLLDRRRLSYQLPLTMASLWPPLTMASLWLLPVSDFCLPLNLMLFLTPKLCQHDFLYRYTWTRQRTIPIQRVMNNSSTKWLVVSLVLTNLEKERKQKYKPVDLKPLKWEKKKVHDNRRAHFLWTKANTCISSLYCGIWWCCHC